MHRTSARKSLLEVKNEREVEATLKKQGQTDGSLAGRRACECQKSGPWSVGRCFSGVRIGGTDDLSEARQT